MPSASSNIGCANSSYKYTISVSWSESSTDINSNTSKITASGSMSAANVSFSANAVYNYYLRLYWHDNRTNTDTLFASSSAFHSCGMSFGSRSVSGSITVTHKDDGSLSGYVKMKFESPSTSGGWAPGTSWVQTANTALTTIARASQPSCVTWPNTTSNVGNMGSTIIIHMNKKASFTHTVRYTWYSKSGTIATNVADNCSWTIPLSFANDIPNATTSWGTIYVDTYSGSTLVGTKSVVFYTNVPASIVPTMGDPIVTRVDNGVPSSWGVYVQSFSKATVYINSAAGAYGSWITSYSITGGGLNSGSTYATTGVLTSSGTVTFTCKITDSRGRSATKTVSINVVPYSTPSVKVSAVRCDASGTETGNGTYLKVTADYAIASVSSKNSVSSRSVVCNGVTSTTHSDGAPFILAANVSIGSTYILTASVTDALGKTASANVDIPTAHRIMNVRKNKKGLAIGKFSEKDAFEVALPSEFNELVKMPQHYIHRVNVAGGITGGYFKIARFTVKSTNIDYPMEITLAQRNSLYGGRLDMLFYGTDANGATEPTLGFFHRHGNLGSAYMVKTGSSVWELYLHKLSVWDEVTVYDVNQHVHTNSKNLSELDVGIEWLNEYSPELPSDYVLASVRGVASSASALYDTLNKQLSYNHNGSSWINARNVAAIRNTGSSTAALAALASQKTPGGSWDIGTIGENLYISYVKDSDLNAGNNTSARLQLLPNGLIGGIGLDYQWEAKSGIYKDREVRITYVRYGCVVTAHINWIGTADTNISLYFSSLAIPTWARPPYEMVYTLGNCSGWNVNQGITRFVFSSNGEVRCSTNVGSYLERRGVAIWLLI